MGDSALTIGVSYDLFNTLKQELQPLSVEPVMALDVNDGLRRFAKSPFQLVVLDLGALGGNSHLEVVTALRSTRYTPLLVLTDKTDVEWVRGLLTRGADMCLSKDCPPSFIVSHAAALVRRYTRYDRYDDPENVRGAPLRVGDIFIDPMRHIVEVRGQPVRLRLREFYLLLHFMRNPGIVLTEEQIAAHALGSSEKYIRSVSTPVSNLRQAIELDPKHPLYIETVTRLGYRFTGYKSE